MCFICSTSLILSYLLLLSLFAQALFDILVNKELSIAAQRLHQYLSSESCGLPLHIQYSIFY